MLLSMDLKCICGVAKLNFLTLLFTWVRCRRMLMLGRTSHVPASRLGVMELLSRGLLRKWATYYMPLNRIHPIVVAGVC